MSLLKERFPKNKSLGIEEVFPSIYYKFKEIDFNKFRYLTDDKLSEDKKILQHMLNLNEDKFDFQKFGSILSLILT